VLYVPSGDSRTALHALVRNRALPNLVHWQLAELVASILQTLGLCRQALLPSTSWHEVANAKDRRTLVKLVLELPIANRDTLSYLMAHWLT